MKLLLAIFALFITSVVSGPVHANELTLDNYSCDGLFGKYHCHKGSYSRRSFASTDDHSGATNHLPKLEDHAPIKRNNSGLCVAPDSVLYNRQKKYRTYLSVKQCVRDGGHIDKTLVLRQ